MIRFRNNGDLHAFVEELRGFLLSRHEVDLADLLARANRYFSVSPAEHRNEVDLALTRVLVLRPKSISGEREDEIRQVIQQISESFGSVGTE